MIFEDAIDHVLRLWSTFYAALKDYSDKNWQNNIICEAKLLIATVQFSQLTYLTAHVSILFLIYFLTFLNDC